MNPAQKILSLYWLNTITTREREIYIYIEREYRLIIVTTGEEENIIP